MVKLFYLSLNADQLNRFHTLYFESIVGVENLDLVPAVNEEVLLDQLLVQLFVVPHQLHLLHLDATVVIPDLLEKVRRLALEYPDWWYILLDEIVDHLYLGKHVLYDEYNSALFNYVVE